MNFDFGEVLSRAWQVTWRHKVFWFITILPFLVVLLLLPIWLAVVFTQDFNSPGFIGLIENPDFVPFLVILWLVLFISSMLLQIVSRASVTLGVYRVEAGVQPVTFGDLLKDGLKYFWRILGVDLSIGAAFIAFFVALMAFVGALSTVTMGMAALCIQPLFILMPPLIWLVVEQAEAAVVADEMGVRAALRRFYELVRVNVGKYILTMIIVYFGMNVLMMLAMFPLMIPMSFFIMSNLESGMGFNNMLQLQAVFALVAFPLMMLVQGVAMTYMKSAMIVMYLRLTRPPVAPRMVLLGAAA